MSFVRRFTSMPSDAVITAIEGINVVDLPPPSSVTGVDQGTMCCVGEFADMTYAAQVVAGVISTKARPQRIFSAQDLLDKVGGWDETLGQFGGDCGNGFAEIRNKKFGQLVVVPVNLASASGIRLWRYLPTNKSATDPTPAVPMSAGTVQAGRPFKGTTLTNDRLRVAQRVTFTGNEAILTGVDGTVAVAAAAATQTFDSTTGDFTTLVRPDGTVGVKPGDILVTGVVGATGAQGDDAGTWRIVSVTDENTLVVQRLDGANFAWTTLSSALVYRIHVPSDADSYATGAVLATAASYDVRARPLTDGANTGSGAANGTWATGSLLAPVVAPPSIGATSWDPLSGLGGSVSNTTALAYTALVQKANAPNDATIDALYQTAIDSLLEDSDPANTVNHVWAARKSSTIRSKLTSHVLSASSVGLGRTCSLSPELDIAVATALATVGGSADPGAGANRDERVFYNWPPVLTSIPEAVGFPIACADGSTTTDGILDTTFDGWCSAVLSNLAPERNPGEVTDTTKAVFAPILGLARNVPALGINEYTYMRTKGICGPRIDKVSGVEIQSGITTNLTNGRRNINRRRMADYCEDSIAIATKPFAKLPYSDELKDGVVGQITDFLDTLQSATNPASQRIHSYLVDDVSGNTPTMESKGIFVVIVKVRTLPTADFIVLQFEVGEGVVTSKQVALE